MFHSVPLFLPSQGYRKEIKTDPTGRKMPFLCPRGGEMSVYEPMKESPALFRTFAAIGDGEADYLQFVNRYGTLGAEEDLWYAPTRFTDEGMPDTEERQIAWKRDHRWSRRICDSLESWRHHRREMRRAVEILDLVLGGKACDEDHDLLGDLIEAYLPSYVETHSRYDPREKRKALLITPRCLLGVMWLQLAMSYHGDREIKSCTVCGKWFVFERTRGRYRQEFCGESCRMKAYRERKARAAELRREGLSGEQIATRLGVRIESVAAWLDDAKA